ncbi:valine--tRNA ligase [Sphingobium nicotianae]|uniref:Valine--tRNA ligase n=1 Tax=Sphingobium nicotianae TaxID=2782607 RepID=A0A9X1IPM0_9SPHN|nr:valine--tRNA ligase [Sphingobium nicotianae]MBT2186016.1 valine--tRNA ligase [Sphingobium nicotianae]
MTELAKTFDPAAIEAKWYQHWEKTGQFRPERPNAAPFTIVNPPPNVTGSLHIGHALDNTLQDIVIRYERLRGKDALWVVGTDHAGIATQMVVERQMEERQDKRTNYTREQFVEKVWEWKAESGGTITGQLRRLGCSMDWSREQFTMDPHFTRAVVKVFVDLYREGLIYRDKRLVNWDPKLKTAISDLEVETREVQGGFWHFKYPLADGVTLDDGRDYIEVATTRPETMLADMAVAVNPQDPRYASVIGKEILQPITGRRFRIVADEHADPELGSGAVKITPGHDFNDFEVGKRAGIKAGDMLNMFDAEALVVQTADGLIPDKYLGQDRFVVRQWIVEDMKALGFLIPHVTKDKEGNETLHDAEPRTIQTPYGDRGGVVIEPWLTDQWYVDAATLAKPAMEAVRSGAIEIVPKTWEKTYFNWMENIQPWCVSRQLWWGHRIPAWFGPHTNNGALIPSFDTHCIVANNETEMLEKAREAYGDRQIVVATRDEAAAYASNIDQRKVLVWRDTDVLDTWFSSALWPFATLGWPEDANPPRNGEVAGAPATDGGGPSDASAESPLHHPSGGPPPRAGEDLLAKHYPNDLLISGFDILFFWDARMAMQGIHFMKDVPWRRLYLHGLVRAADGQKMSKSKGNVVDPLGLIDQYGADALRFFMAAMESQGRDVKMDEKRVEGYRNFATKLWNAVRFAQANGIGASNSVAAPLATLPVNKWIVGEVVATLAELDKAMAELRFDAAANAIYHFVWDQFCDWYLELIKPILSPLPFRGGDRGGAESVPSSSFIAEDPHPNPSPEGEGLERDETRAVAGWVIDQILVMLHPFMPFITEELWHAQGERPYDLIVAKWPEPAAQVDAQASNEIDWLIRLVSEIRSARTELNVPPGARVPMRAIVDDPAEAAKSADLVKRHAATLLRMARVQQVGEADFNSAGATAQLVVDGILYALSLEGAIDLDAERARLTKSLSAAQKEAQSLEGRLANPAFVEKAKPEAVEKARADHAEKVAESERLAAALARLG